MRALTSALVLSVLCACGPREAGFAPNELLRWRIVEATASYAQCSDAEVWRAQFAPPDVSRENFSVSVAVDGTGREAVLVNCVSASNCQSSEPEVRFTVAGTELIHGGNQRVEIRDSPCQIAVAERIVIVDEGSTMSLHDVLTFTLVEDDAACAAFDAQLRSQSPNGLGADGCVVEIRMKGQL